ncbi:hypothetical protein CAEBREN_20790 [Caenorhabditis brenneri]|uniref:RING-type domain-containing protein n=1 Tax=Caenorhabditis brenneri TaxID=135651 RepID=G0MUS8_CAEBE|nr:hypothetical protein CAEBREN_20790 [Caenorhabditis brenneri]
MAMFLMLLLNLFRSPFHRELPQPLRLPDPDDEEHRRQKKSLKKRIKKSLQKRVHKCPICLSEAKFPVMTDCGHIFCCSCIIRSWKESKPVFIPCDCAMCRYTFFKLVPIRWPAPGISDEIDDQLQKNKEKLDDYNNRFSIERLPMDTIRDAPGFIINQIKANWIDSIRVLMFFLVYASVMCGAVVEEDMMKEWRRRDEFLMGILLIYSAARWRRNW